MYIVPCTYTNMVKMQDNAQECQRERGQQEQADTMIAAVPTTVYYHSIRFTYLLSAFLKTTTILPLGGIKDKKTPGQNLERPMLWLPH